MFVRLVIFQAVLSASLLLLVMTNNTVLGALFVIMLPPFFFGSSLPLPLLPLPLPLENDSKCLGPDFVPYLPLVMPPLLAAASANVSMWCVWCVLGTLTVVLLFFILQHFQYPPPNLSRNKSIPVSYVLGLFLLRSISLLFIFLLLLLDFSQCFQFVGVLFLHVWVIIMEIWVGQV